MNTAQQLPGQSQVSYVWALSERSAPALPALFLHGVLDPDSSTTGAWLFHLRRRRTGVPGRYGAMLLDLCRGRGGRQRVVGAALKAEPRLSTDVLAGSHILAHAQSVTSQQTLEDTRPPTSVLRGCRTALLQLGTCGDAISAAMGLAHAHSSWA
jgi:hypothetical protein